MFLLFPLCGRCISVMQCNNSMTKNDLYLFPLCGRCISLMQCNNSMTKNDDDVMRCFIFTFSFTFFFIFPLFPFPFLSLLFGEYSIINGLIVSMNFNVSPILDDEKTKICIENKLQNMMERFVSLKIEN